MKTKYKLVPVEPTREMWEAARDAVVSLHSQHSHAAISEVIYKAMLTAVPEMEPEGFCEDTVLSLAERTFSTEVDEQLAEDIIQYARRLHSRYSAPQPTPEVAKLVEVLVQVIKAAPSSEPLWHGSLQIVEARVALAAYYEHEGKS